MLKISPFSTSTQLPSAHLRSTGWPTLDFALGGGWQLGELHELLGAGFGVGEFSALLPTLADASARRRGVALIHPPHQPYAPALCAAGITLPQLVVIEPKSSQAACWAAEHCLRALSDGVVILWTQETQTLSDVALRRLRRAAQLGGSLCIVLRPAWAANTASPAPVRLHYASAAQGITLRVIKRRGSSSNGSNHDRSGHETTVNLALPAAQFSSDFPANSSANSSADFSADFYANEAFNKTASSRPARVRLLRAVEA